MQWVIENEQYAQQAAADNGNRFLVGNGYLGVRGTLDEHGKEQLAAVNLAGIYDRVGDGWREPLNAPNPLHTALFVDGRPLALPETAPESHSQSLNYRNGIFSRCTHWPGVTVESRRAAHMADPHLILSEYSVTADTAMTVELTARIETDIWEIYGPHYSSFQFDREKSTLTCLAQVQNSQNQVAVGRCCTVSASSGSRQELPDGFSYRMALSPGEKVTLQSVCAVYTALDTPDPLKAVKAALCQPDFAGLLQRHKNAWEAVWARGEVKLEGDDEARDALNYSLYHLNAIAPRHRDDLSIPARGLSGQTYKGAIFWDSEMFMLDYFLYTQPEVARSMVRYRINTLPGALEKARSYGWQGAFYAWESQEGGYDGCTDYNVTDVFTKRPMRTFFRDKQVHISAAVARAVMLYVRVTGDTALLAQGGAETLLECARFYRSLLLRYAGKSRWEIHDVIGPDEYHERVNNNAYTNKMAQAAFLWAVEGAAMLEKSNPAWYADFLSCTDAETLLPELDALARELYIPQPNEQGVIEQFDGYFGLEDIPVETVRGRLLDPREYWGGAYGVASQTQVIKQADVVTMLEMFHGDYPGAVLKANWDYYEPRTEHGSSLSACMYALLACRCGDPQSAYPFFLKSAKSDWNGGGKQWAGLVYIGGTHPAAEGGAWKVLAQGFAGLALDENGPKLAPALPEGWKKLSFRVCIRNRWYHAVITPDGSQILPE